MKIREGSVVQGEVLRDRAWVQPLCRYGVIHYYRVVVCCAKGNICFVLPELYLVVSKRQLRGG